MQVPGSPPPAGVCTVNAHVHK